MLLRHARRSTTTLLAALLALFTLPQTQGTAEAAAFTDTEGTVYETAVDALVERGVTVGCTEDRFCATDTLRRDQLGTLLFRALELRPVEADRFEDLVDNDHEVQVESLAAHEVVDGCSLTEYCPSTATTRGQLATMIDGAFELPATDVRSFTDGGPTHGPAIDRLAAAGIAAGCGDPLTDFCTHAPVTRGQAALFIARALDLVEPVSIAPLAERQAEQAELDRIEAERLEAERLAAAEAEAAAAAAEADAAAAARLQIWEDLARCESGGNWSINTGNGYYGGLQFSLSSWRAVGGSGYPHQNSKAEQIHRGEKLQAIQGWGAWPACSLKLGLR